ncbi:glycosyl hydrolase [Pelagicoccus sp. SDUM812002]|uniref:glycosyl hydrolase n=1 Tax=Pelagicoccus sp. SDUM812002 TaxID=3041266 RepID=UPI00280E5226|nr:glycosyl hydrolase [Pelagicoccus sp. SDUM812002]MDQ8184030.1 glycosyl hydrolase [Pelagicoccus sp. SDUM812002]
MEFCPRLPATLFQRLLPSIIIVCAATFAAWGQSADWPEPTSTNKPWTRWWWHGSAVTKEGISRELEEFRSVGIGGVEITPIYGVQGLEHLEKEFLSDEWLELIEHACLEAQRLGLLVDIVPGTGWRLGHEFVPESERAVELKLHKEINGEQIHYEIEPELSGERVKRPAPGGSGYTIDMLDREAVSNYLDRFHERFFEKVSPNLIRAVFHDSWEYETDWSHDFERELQSRGRLTSPDAYSIFDTDRADIPQDTIERWRYDYRKTLEELLLENFSDTWAQKTHAYHLFTRNQAHGSIANLLDVYAKSDIPETEIFGDSQDFLMHKFSSSAAHVTGKKLVSAESYTWLSEHWTSDLAKIKRATDYLFLCGVNHLFYHGTAYSPADAAWPGWVFYASTQLNNRNPLWHHIPALNTYIARVQTVLQEGQPHADLFLYSPIADPYSEIGGTKLRQNIDGRDWFKGTGLEHTSKQLWEAGVHFDFISDRQIEQRVLSSASTPTIVLPSLKRIPLRTVKALDQLARQGIKVISLVDPKEWIVPGYHAHEKRQAELDAFVTQAVESNRIHYGTTEDILNLVPDTWQELSTFRTIRRIQDDGTHSYFIVNRSDERESVNIPLPTKSSVCRRLDPWTGQIGISPLNDGILTLSLEPYQSTIIQTVNERAEDRATFATNTAGGTTIALLDDWTLSFRDGGPTLPESRLLESLSPITKLGEVEMENFAGLLAYENRFRLSSKQSKLPLRIDLGELSSSGQLFVNGDLVGTSILKPHTLEIPADTLRTGDNLLRVEIATLATNRIRHLDRTKTPWRIFKDINLVNIDYRAFDASDWEVAPYGLLGPVQITETSARQ